MNATVVRNIHRAEASAVSTLEPFDPRFKI